MTGDGTKPPRNKGGRPPTWTRARKDAYLEELRKTGQPGLSAKALGSCRRVIVRMREADPAFDAECKEAMLDYKEWVITQVQHHAWEGVQEPIFQGGRMVGVKKLYNTQMMILEAKRVVPEYRDRFHLEHGADKSIPLQMSWVPKGLRGKAEQEEEREPDPDGAETDV